MDFFSLLPSTPPRKKKQKISVREGSPHPTPDAKTKMRELEPEAELKIRTGAKRQKHIIKEADPAKIQKRRNKSHLKRGEVVELHELLKKWDLHTHYTIGGTESRKRLGCHVCMQYLIEEGEEEKQRSTTKTYKDSKK